MKNVKKFNEFVLEKKGISDICIIYKNCIWKNMIDKLKDVETSESFKKDNFKTIVNLSYDFSNPKFLVKNFMIELALNKNINYSCGGLANVEYSMYDDGILISPKIVLNLSFKDLNKGYLNYVESVLLHEIIHVYQRYCQGDKNISSSWQLGSILPKLRNIIISDDVSNILELLYYSLVHEINSQLHQYFDMKMKNINYKDIFDIKKRLEDFDYTKIVIDDEIIDELEQIRKHYYASLKYNKPNNMYIKNVSNIWKKEISIDNVYLFLEELKQNFTNSIVYIEKKIKLIDNKISEIRYDNASNYTKFNECINI